MAGGIRLFTSGLTAEIDMDAPAGPHVATGSLKDGRGRRRGWRQREGNEEADQLSSGGGGRTKERSGLGSRRRERIPSGASGHAGLPTPRCQPRGAPPDSGTPRGTFVLFPATALVAVSAQRQGTRPAVLLPVAGGTWCCELLLRFGVQEEPPGAPSCGLLRVPHAAGPPAIGSWTATHTQAP